MCQRLKPIWHPKTKLSLSAFNTSHVFPSTDVWRFPLDDVWITSLTTRDISRTYLIQEGFSSHMRDFSHTWRTHPKYTIAAHLDSERKNKTKSLFPFTSPRAWGIMYWYICEGPTRGDMGGKLCNTSPITPSWSPIYQTEHQSFGCDTHLLDWSPLCQNMDVTFTSPWKYEEGVNVGIYHIVLNNKKLTAPSPHT